jgi:predicted 3-demethylubiquinone-9 3-methyltransferase (glyoxalase superfamily)
MQKIVPFLWFASEAEAAVKFYTSIFKKSKIGKIERYRAGWPGPAGAVMTVAFTLEGQEFIALNGGPGVFTFSPAISLFVNCETQKEVDGLWKKLSKGGKPKGCAWITDKFGVTWQIVPTILGKLLFDKNQVKSDRVMKAMLKMDKIDIKKLKKAHAW